MPLELGNHQLPSDAAHVLQGLYGSHQGRMSAGLGAKVQSVREVFAAEANRTA